MAATVPLEKLENESKFIAVLSLTEVGIGSLLHSFHVPLSGHFMSLNQALVLCRSQAESQNRLQSARSICRISVVSALLKSLSPAGKVLTPMLAISTQGLLFSFGVLLAGTGKAGRVLGSVFLSFWGIAQPLILATLIFGKDFFQGLAWTWEKITSSLGLDARYGIQILIALVIIKAILAGLLALVSAQPTLAIWNEQLARKGQSLLGARPAQRAVSPIQGTLRDLSSPIFLFSLFLTGTFVFMSRSEESVSMAWVLVRPVAVAFVIFYLIRVFPGLKFSQWVMKHSPMISSLFQQVKPRLARPQSDPDSEEVQPQY
jgi:hypothetical protein